MAKSLMSTTYTVGSSMYWSQLSRKVCVNTIPIMLWGKLYIFDWNKIL